MTVLDDYDLALLRSIARSQVPHLLPSIGLLAAGTAPGEEYEALRAAVAAELACSGRGSDGSPNNKGQILEDLLCRLDLARATGRTTATA